MIVVFLGPPGSGKGTQAKRLTAATRLPQLSTGDMFRSAIQNGTLLGREAKGFMDRGELVPDSVVIGLVQERIQQADCAKGFILDGFPRTLAQARAFQTMLQDQKLSMRRVVYFEIPEEELVDRLSGRETCSQCGKMYHSRAMPTRVQGICDVCGGRVVVRDDDSAAVVRQRLRVYQEQTAPLVQFYESLGILGTVQAGDSPDAVEGMVKRQLAL